MGAGGVDFLVGLVLKEAFWRVFRGFKFLVHFVLRLFILSLT